MDLEFERVGAKEVFCFPRAAALLIVKIIFRARRVVKNKGRDDVVVEFFKVFREGLEAAHDGSIYICYIEQHAEFGVGPRMTI